MPILVLLTWVTCLALFVSLSAILVLRYGARALLIPMLLAFIPPIIFFPFAFDSANASVVGPYQFRRIISHLPQAWYVFGSTATLFIIALFVAATQRRRVSVRRFGFIDRGFTKIVISDAAANALFLFEGLLFVFLIASGFRYGAGTFSAFDNTSLRPVMNAANSLLSLGVLISAIRLMNQRSVGRVLVLLVTLFMSGLSGQRGIALVPLIIFSAIFLSVRGIKVSVWPAVLAIIMLPLAMAMADYRATAIPVRGVRVAQATSQRGAIYRFVYGNQFSDVRDLSWIMSGFDGRLLLGRTYLAGYTPFIPSAFWSYRRQWGFGDWTVRQAGLDPERHSGLRGGFFSELYFNFGLIVAMIGAIAAGTIYGRILHGEVDHDAEVTDRVRRSAISLSSYNKVLVTLSVMFTPGFFGVPVMFGLLFAVDALVRIGPRGQARLAT